MEIRDSCPEVHEKLGQWTAIDSVSNKQIDGHSCGVFVLMVIKLYVETL
jgi:Ulp1 family protease